MYVATRFLPHTKNDRKINAIENEINVGENSAIICFYLHSINSKSKHIWNRCNCVSLLLLVCCIFGRLEHIGLDTQAGTSRKLSVCLCLVTLFVHLQNFVEWVFICNSIKMIAFSTGTFCSYGLRKGHHGQLYQMAWGEWILIIQKDNNLILSVN